LNTDKSKLDLSVFLLDEMKIMKKHLIIFSFCLIPILLYGQIEGIKSDRTIWYNDGEIMLPLTMMALGVMTYVHPVKKHIQLSTLPYRNSFVGFEDYLQFGPSLIQATVSILNLKGRNNVKNQLKYLLISEVSTLSMVYLLKISINETRPNGGRWSFPSGHTAQGFASATILYQQYKNSHPILAYSGYSMALATGLLRVAHNKHWVNDVLFGAGLGILVPNLVHRIKKIGIRKQGKLHTLFTTNKISLIYTFS